MPRTLFSIALALALFLFPALSLSRRGNEKSLRIYFIDVEGGQSTLLVDPAGESLLVDAGWAWIQRARRGSHRSRRKIGRNSPDRRAGDHALPWRSRGRRCRKSRGASRSPPSSIMARTWKIPIAPAPATPRTRKSRPRQSHGRQARRPASLQGHESRRSWPPRAKRSNLPSPAGNAPNPLVRLRTRSAGGSNRERAIGGHAHHLSAISAFSISAT